jgi:phage recombination protein Bet
MSAVTPLRPVQPAATDSDLIQVLESSFYPGASPESIGLVLGYCKAAGLDPMQRPVHIVPMWDNKGGRMRDVVMPGIGLYRTGAARTGEYAGIGDPEFGPDVSETIGGAQITYPQWCRVTVKRALKSGAIVEFSAREFWRECYAAKGGKERSVAPNAMWAKRPYGMLAKCAEAQALRKAFPELGSAPTAEEMIGQAVELEAEAQPITPAAAPAIAALPVASEGDFAISLQKFAALVSSGKKTAGDILATVSSKYELTPEQRQAIAALDQPQYDANDAWLDSYNSEESA